jgi:subtilisin-like proprotein convertase family protein/subtilisin family serine protease
MLLGWLMMWGERQRPVNPPEMPQRKHMKLSQIEKRARALPEAQKHALEDMLAGRPLVLVADGRPQRFTLSMSEVVVNAGPVNERYRQLPLQSDARALMQAAKKLGDYTLVLYPQGREGEPAARHFLKNRLLIQSRDREATLATLRLHGLRLLSEPEYAPGSLIVESLAAGPEAILTALAVLADAPGTVSVGPLLGRYHQKHLVPNDPLFTQQWFLKNTGQSGGVVGMDMRVETVWNTYQGSGIRIAIVDDGLDLLHPDLAPNVDTANHYDWNSIPYDTDPAPLLNPDPAEEDTHGTAVGGVAGARGNNAAGVSGVAPEATLVGFRLISFQDPDGTSDDEDADAMARGKDIIDIKNNSWGTGAPAWVTIPAGPLMEAARADAAHTGRAGKGTVYVWAAGNGRQSGQQGQKDGATNSMYATTVGGLDHRGNLAVYSEGGSHLVVVAPTSGGSGTLPVVTTDLRGNSGYNRTGTAQGEPADRNYTDSFGGTSSAAPAVSGAIALMLDANPNLNWRDVKEILLRSSRQIIPTDSGWLTRHGGDPSLPLIKHHESYGGGLIDAQAAVTMAQTWTSLGPMTSDSRSSNLQRTILDNNTTGISIPFDFSALTAMRVEHAQVRLDASHNWRGDLVITLRSPSGVISNLATEEIRDDGSDYEDWDFSSVRHWGEAAAGIWTLSIKDVSAGVSGTFHSATLTLHGTDVSPLPQITSLTSTPQLLRSGDALNLSCDGTGGGRLAFIWSRNGNQVSGNSKTFAIPAVSMAHGGSYRATAYNGGGSAASAEIPVCVLGIQPVSMAVNQAGSLSLTVSAAGPGLTYEWRRGGFALSNGAKVGGGAVSGADAAFLTVSNMQAEDIGSYTCLVGLPGAAQSLETTATAVSVIFRPALTQPTFGNGVRGSAVNLQFTASNSPTSFTVTGLPPGVLLLKSTGQMTGRPTRPGSYLLTLTASNSAGTGAPLQYAWIIEDFPTAAVGVWQGITARNNDLNQLLGGRIKLTISASGSYSGSLTLGTRTRSWTGFVDALPGGTDPSTPLSIPMGTGITPLVGSFTLDLTALTMTGDFTDGRPTALTMFEGAKQAWSSTNKPVTASTLYNSALEVPAIALGDPGVPQGTGYSTMSLSTAGMVTWGGRLSDGTTITGGSPLGRSGQASLHALLYASTGSLQGWADITLASGLTDGALDWFKSRQKDTSTTRSYKAGFASHSLTLRGARYTKPATGTLILGLALPTSSLDQNARLRFTGAPLTTPLVQLFQVTPTNAVKLPTGTANPQSIRLTLAPTTGLLSGGFTFRDSDPLDLTPPIAIVTRSATYYALLITRPDLRQGIGFFNLAELADEPGEKNTSTKILSGNAELTAP